MEKIEKNTFQQLVNILWDMHMADKTEKEMVDYFQCNKIEVSPEQFVAVMRNIFKEV